MTGNSFLLHTWPLLSTVQLLYVITNSLDSHWARCHFGVSVALDCPMKRATIATIHEIVASFNSSDMQSSRVTGTPKQFLVRPL